MRRGLCQLLAAHALDLAMLAEKIERNGSGDNDPMGKPRRGAPMSHIVEVRQIGGELAEAMAAMRIWLDHNGIEIATFEHSQGGPGITIPNGDDGRTRAEPAACRDKQLHGSRSGAAEPRRRSTRRKASRRYATRGGAGDAGRSDHPAPAFVFVARRKRKADRSRPAADTAR